jgi:hypothetical protein
MTETNDERYTLDDIASIAYELWEQRGGEGVSPVEDWLEAERLLRGRPEEATQ